jgi:chemotaxis protein MotB
VSGSEEGKAHELVIIRRRSAEGDDKHHGGVWKIAYADFMTAMMAFFLVMWLINSTDKKTLTQVATYFNPMRLTDKRPSPKGLEEPDGNEGKENAAQKGAKKKEKDGEAKGAKKTEDTQPGEVRSRGKPFQRELEDVEKKVPTENGATSGESPRQAGGRAFRDPFDTVQRTEIIPSDPASGRAERMAPRPAAPATPDVERRAADARRPDLADPPMPAAGEMKARETAEPKSSPPPEEKPNPSPEAKASEAMEPVSAVAAEAKTGSPPPPKGEAERADAAQLEAAIKKSLGEALPGVMPNVDVTVTPDGVLISLTDDFDFGMFAIASAEPRPAMAVVMDKVAKILQTRPEPLIVRGHTDRRPYRTATYDNWRLSAARAHMAYVMLMRGGVDDRRFERIEGHADRNLRVQVDPEAAQNRRIEILLRKQTP